MQDFQTKKLKLFKALRGGKELTSELEELIISAYGPRGKRAIEAVKDNRVVKRGERWFVTGRKGEEYEVVRNYCACPDYVLNVVTGKAGVDLCYHALAKLICEMLGEGGR